MNMQTARTGLLHLCGLLLVAALLAPMGAVAQTTVKYIHTDALGSVVAMTNTTGTVIEGHREYEAYGEQLTPAVQDGPGYTGHVQDAATGLTYMQQRYYDPQLGLFLSVDPVTAYDQPTVAFNRYRYANNNPYRFTDPDGRNALLTTAEGAKWGTVACGPWCGVAGAVIGLGVGLWVSNEIADAVQNSGSQETPSQPVPGAVDLADDLAGQEAISDMEAGEGKVLEGMGDPKFDRETGTHDKVAISRPHPDGTKTEVHGDRNRESGKVENAKIKQDHDASRDKLQH